MLSFTPDIREKAPAKVREGQESAPRIQPAGGLGVGGLATQGEAQARELQPQGEGYAAAPPIALPGPPTPPPHTPRMELGDGGSVRLPGSRFSEKRERTLKTGKPTQSRASREYQG